MAAITTDMSARSSSSIPLSRYDIHFPQRHQKGVPQDEEWCEIFPKGESVATRVRFHDYAQVFSYPGLYNQLFGGPDSETQCVSPQFIASLLQSQLHHILQVPVKEGDSTVLGESSVQLCVLDVGAGNGLIGEQIRAFKDGRKAIVVGCDITPEAKIAAEHDFPGIYDIYLTADLTALREADSNHRILRKLAPFNIMTVVSALGFKGIPLEAFVAASAFVEDGGLIAFNLKDDFVEGEPELGSGSGVRSESGVAKFIRESVSKRSLCIVSKETYRHRLSVTGESITYIAFVAKKTGNLG
jgi:predicted TPR repeat methyltransferase